MNSVLQKVKNFLTITSPKPEPIFDDLYPDLYDSDGNVILQSESASLLLKDWKEPKGFDKVGYARPLGGFFYEFFFALIGAGFLAALYIPFLSFFYPWPESKSMTGIAGILFAIVNRLFDVPTNYAIERFIGEWRIKDTRKMIQYIRFYVWYQMLTGIILITGFSGFVLYSYNTGDLVWAKWLMLISISKQYPANTGVFLSTMKGLQRLDLESYVNFAKGTFIEPFFEYAFVLWGHFVLGKNPAIGPLYGIAIGYAVGTYVDDFVSMGVSMYYLKKCLKPMNFTLRDCFVPHVEKEIMVNCMKFGVAVAIPGLVGSIWGTITTLWWYNMLPAYLTLTALSKLADELVNIIKRGGGINVKAAISEAINNGKHELTSYYISLMWKFIFFFMFALGAVVFSFIPLIFEDLFMVFGAEEYILAAAFITPNIIATIFEEPDGAASNIILGANRPFFMTVINIAFDIVNVAMLYIWFFIVEIQNFGIGLIVWFIPLWAIIPNIIKLVIKWWYIDRRIAPVKFKEFSWQAFIAPIAPAIIVALIALFWREVIFPILEGLTGTLIAGVISILFAFVFVLMFTFFPLYSFFGGWDDNTFNIFTEAVNISGPSRFLFKPIVWSSKLLIKVSPLHNRFAIKHELAEKEATDLMQERYIKDILVKKLEGNAN